MRLLILLALAGCGQVVDSQGIRVAQHLCEPHGGLSSITGEEQHGFAERPKTIRVSVSCSDGTEITSTRIPQQ